jgi:hypothetical protein
VRVKSAAFVPLDPRKRISERGKQKIILQGEPAINSPSKLGCLGVFSGAKNAGKLDGERVLVPIYINADRFWQQISTCNRAAELGDDVEVFELES